MTKRKLVCAMLLLALTAAGLFLLPRFLPQETPKTDDILEVRFLNVGQGDCAVVQCGGECLLIDGGAPKESRFVYSYLKNTLSLAHIDHIVATHPDSDHIGGLSAALNACTAGTIYSPVTENDIKPFQSLCKYAEQQGKTLTVPKAGDTFSVGSAKVTFLGPVREYPDDNNGSLVLRIDFGETSFLFTGDAETDAERDMLAEGTNLRATVLKVAHHGSASSTSQAFLDAVRPAYAVISVGENGYGHPAQTTLQALTDIGAEILRTDERGSILCRSDGKTLMVSCERQSAASQEKSAPVPTAEASEETREASVTAPYIGNANSKKFHGAGCASVSAMKEKNKVPFATRQEALDAGYVPCKACGGE